MLYLRIVITAIASTCFPLIAQAPRTYTYDTLGNRLTATNQIRFTSVAGFAIEPRRAFAGDRVNLYGRNFPIGQNAAVTVSFNGTPGTVLSVAERVITAVVPNNVTGGPVTISVQGGAAIRVGDLAVQGVAVTPAVVDVNFNEQRQFSATVIGATNPAVSWSVTDTRGGTTGVGSITQTGLYTAPAPGTPFDFQFVVRATNTELRVSSQALVRLRCPILGTLRQRQFANGTLAATNELHGWEFGGRAGRQATVMLFTTAPLSRLTIRSPSGTALARSGGSNDVRLMDVVLPETGTYRVELQAGAPTGQYELWLDQHDTLPLGVWVFPRNGDWHVATNWSRGQVPGESDDIVVDDFPRDITITVDRPARCTSVMSKESLLLRGALSTTSKVDVYGTLTLDGVTLMNTAVNVPTRPMVVTATSGNRLDGVTVNGGIDLTATGSALTVANGLRVTGTVRVTAPNSNLSFDGSQTFQGGILVIASNAVVQMVNGGTLTVAPDATIRGYGNLGYASMPALINQGTIEADTPGVVLEVRPKALTNTGTLRVLTGARMDIQNNLTTSPTWTNSGTVDIRGGTLNVHSEVLVPAAGAFTSTGGTLNLIQGVVQAAGATLDLRGSGTWSLDRGTIVGGTVNLAGTNSLVVTAGRLDGVKVNGLVDVASGSNLTVANDLRVTGAVQVTAQNSSLSFDGSQTFQSGTLLLARNGVVQMVNGGTLTVAEGATIRGYGNLGYASMPGLVNHGTIEADTPGVTLEVRPKALTNTGTLRVRTGARMDVQNNLTTSPTWTNSGSVDIQGGVLNVHSSSVAPASGAFTSNGGTLNFIESVVNATGATLDLQGTGTWLLDRSTIVGGTVNVAAPNFLSATASRLDGVKVNGRVDVASGANLTVANDLRVTGTVRVTAQNSSLSFDGSQTFQSGTLELANNGVVQMVNGGTLTIAPAATIRGYGNLGYAGMPGLVNHGTIEADTPGVALEVRPKSLTNTGTLRVLSGARMDIQNNLTTSPDWTNSGTVDIRAGTVNVHSSSVVPNGGRVTNNNGRLSFVQSTINATGAALDLQGTGTWALDRSTVVGGTVNLAAPHTLTVTVGRLEGVKFNGLLDIAAGSSLAIANDLRVTGTVRVTQSSIMTFDGTQTFHSGTVVLASGGVVQMTNGGTLTIGPDAVVRGHGNLGNGGMPGLVNQGTIEADALGQVLEVRPKTLTNSGTLRVLAGARMDVQSNLTTSPTWTNTGLVQIRGGTMNLLAAAPLNSATGTVEGTGTLAANLINSGVIRPGLNDIGTLSIAGTYTETASGKLDLEFASLTQFDRLAVSGAASYAGALSITLLGGYLPVVSNTFDIVTHASATGAFVTCRGCNLQGGRTLVPSYNAGNARLTVQ